jgi:hypothetical protein
MGATVRFCDHDSGVGAALPSRNWASSGEVARRRKYSTIGLAQKTRQVTGVDRPVPPERTLLDCRAAAFSLFMWRNGCGPRKQVCKQCST